MKTNTTVIAGLKMGNKPMILAGILEMLEAPEEEVQKARSASRVTTALLNRLLTPYLGDAIPEHTPEPETQPETTPDTTELKFEDVRKAIKKGKRKKALKLIKKHASENQGSMLLETLKKEAEEL